LLTDRRTGGGDARSPNGDVDRNSISIVSQRVTGCSRHGLNQQYLDRTAIHLAIRCTGTLGITGPMLGPRLHMQDPGEQLPGYQQPYSPSPSNSDGVLLSFLLYLYIFLPICVSLLLGLVLWETCIYFRSLSLLTTILYSI